MASLEGRQRHRQRRGRAAAGHLHRRRRAQRAGQKSPAARARWTRTVAEAPAGRARRQVPDTRISGPSAFPSRRKQLSFWGQTGAMRKAPDVALPAPSTAGRVPHSVQHDDAEQVQHRAGAPPSRSGDQPRWVQLVVKAAGGEPRRTTPLLNPRPCSQGAARGSCHALHHGYVVPASAGWRRPGSLVSRPSTHGRWSASCQAQPICSREPVDRPAQPLLNETLGRQPRSRFACPMSGRRQQGSSGRGGICRTVALPLTQAQHLLGQSPHGHLLQVAQIDGPDRLFVVHQRDKTAHGIADIAERACLLTIAMQWQGLATRAQAMKVVDHAAIVRPQSRPVGVEQTRHPHLRAVLPRMRIIISASARRLPVVAAARYRVDMAPVVFGLRMNRRITVHPRWWT